MIPNDVTSKLILCPIDEFRGSRITSSNGQPRTNSVVVSKQKYLSSREKETIWRLRKKKHKQREPKRYLNTCRH